MTETNIRIVEPGTGLLLRVRLCSLSGQEPNRASFERVCNILRRRERAAAILGSQIVVLTADPVERLVLREDDWHAEVCDTGERRDLAFAEHPGLLAQLLGRRLLIQVARLGRWWRLKSPRIWYEIRPFSVRDGVAAYRRYEISSAAVDGVGAGLVVDVGTAFFTEASVADFYSPNWPEGREQFERLSQRQYGQRGTLRYDLGGATRKVCYFERVIPGETCATTGELPVRERSYPSLFAYYQERYPHLGVKESDPVARVSFPGMGRPVPVAANRLFVRVMNNALPRNLKQVDKVATADRRRMIDGFWAAMEPRPLGDEHLVLRSGYWRPPMDRTSRCEPPTLLFGRNARFKATGAGTDRDFFKKRLGWLGQVGCFHVPPTAPREIYFAVPNTVDQDTASDFADDLSACLSRWTKLSISILGPQFHADLHAGIDALQSEAHGRPGSVLFVFSDNDPCAYETVSRELKNWRVKRVTVRQLVSIHRSQRNRTGSSGWKSFTELCALDVLQQMDCVPWRPAADLRYQAHLAIDVSYDRRYYALSLLICRANALAPGFWLDSSVEHKTDIQNETINEVQLRDTILKLFRKARKRDFVPLKSVLVLRDGRKSGREFEAAEDAAAQLKKDCLLAPDCILHVVDVHKHSQKRMRLWDLVDGRIENVCEGTFVLLGKRAAILANTGRGTLHQGTVEPVILEAVSEGADIREVVADAHASSHMNWSSPGVAQRLPIELKRTDEQLESRTAREIRRIR